MDQPTTHTDTEDDLDAPLEELQSPGDGQAAAVSSPGESSVDRQVSAALQEAEDGVSALTALLALTEPPPARLGQTLGACAGAADLLTALAASEAAEDAAGPDWRRRAGQLRCRLDELRQEAAGRLQGAQQQRLQWELAMWRLEQWLLHTDRKLDALPSADRPELWDDTQSRRFRVSADG